MSAWRVGPGVLVSLALGALPGCGLEALLMDLLDGSPELVVVDGALLEVEVSSEISGSPTFLVADLAGNELARVTDPLALEPGVWRITVPPEAAVGPLRVAALSGDVVLKGLYFCLLPENLEGDHHLQLSAESTAATLLMESLGNYRGDARDTLAQNNYALAALASDELETVHRSVLDAIATQSGEIHDFYQDVVALLAAGDASGTGNPMFVPVATSGTLVDPGFVSSAGVDFDAETFDAAAATIADTLHSSLAESFVADEYQPGVPFLTTIFSVNFNDGNLDGNCNPLSPCNDGGGKSFGCDGTRYVMFTGGVHQDSPIKDPAIDVQLGEMTPNLARLMMFDDGTHGDEVAGDLIYTITFRLPVGLRLRYKYTYGAIGQDWKDSEEWPGNNRILEIQDIDGDGYVWRHDNVKDEATNKDKYNLFGYQSGGVTITWDTDLNGDGYAEATENPVAYDITDAAAGIAAPNGDCWQNFSGWLHPTRSPRATPGQCRAELVSDAGVEDTSTRAAPAKLAGEAGLPQRRPRHADSPSSLFDEPRAPAAGVPLPQKSSRAATISDVSSTGGE